MIYTIVVGEQSEAFYNGVDDTQSIDNRYNESSRKKDHISIYEASVLKIIGQQKEIKFHTFPHFSKGF